MRFTYLKRENSSLIINVDLVVYAVDIWVELAGEAACHRVALAGESGREAQLGV